MVVEVSKQFSVTKKQLWPLIYVCQDATGAPQLFSILISASLANR
jgi:hypothetical protein